MRKLILMGAAVGGLGIAIAPLVLGANAVHTIVETTQTVDFPSGGTVRLSHAAGEVTIEGWDQASLELTAVKSTFQAAARLERVKVTAERKGDDVGIVTSPERHTGVQVEYRLRVPREAKLTIEHGVGEINISDVTGAIRADSRQGVIMLHLPQNGSVAIDAKTKVGSVVSDFPGKDGRRWIFGHSLLESPPAASQQLYLRGRYGDILILKKLIPAK